jgi:hypothetical protein
VHAHVSVVLLVVGKQRALAGGCTKAARGLQGTRKEALARWEVYI